MLWYKLNGTWQTWDYLHNTLGYSESATYAVSYKQASQANWGQAYTGDGYHDGSQNDYTDGTFWANGKVGWYNLNDLAETCELYPSDASVGPTFKNDEQSSNSVFVRDSYQNEYYLIQKALELGWVTVEEAADAGWNITEREKTPIGGVLTATSDEVVEVDTPYQLEIGTISFTGELRENIIPESGVVEEWANNTIELDLGFSYFSGSGGVWRAEDLYSGNSQLLMPISQTDADSLTSFGVQLQTYGSSYEGPFGHLGNGNTAFSYEIVCLYTDLDGGGGSNPISIDPSDFSVIAGGWPSVDGMYLTCEGRYNPVKGCRIKITKPE